MDTFPSSREVQTDVLEWFCQLVLQPCNDPEIYAQRAQGCLNVLEQIGDSIPNQGRLFNRTQLASLCCDLRNRDIHVQENGSNDEEDDDDEDDLPLSKLTPDMWKEYRDVLESVRSNLLRKDAANDENEEPDDEVDDVREGGVKFNKDYDTVVTLLSLCQVVATFFMALNDLQSSRAKKKKTLLQKLETAVDNYKRGIEQLDYLEEEHQQLLTNVILSDLYKANTKPKELAQQLHADVLKIMVNPDNTCGYACIVETTRRLLSQWNNLVLGVPTLCKLGYGGFAKQRKNSIYDDNASDVSSFGYNEEEEEQVKERMEEVEEEGQQVAAEEEKEDSSDDLAGYATAATQDDDATADEAEVAMAFQPSTQPPIPEEVQETPEKYEQQEEEHDGDKKPRAKRKIAETEDDEEKDKKDEDFQETNKPRTCSDDMPRRSSRLTISEPTQVPARKGTEAQSPPKAASKPKSIVFSEEEALNNPFDDDDNGSDSTPPKKKAALARRKPPTPGGDDESITEPESSPPRQKKKTGPVARRPPPESDDSSTESESKQAPGARPRPQPVARRAPKKKPTVIEWSGSEDDDIPLPPPPPPKRARYRGGSTSGGRRRSSGGTRKKYPGRRFFTTEEKLAIKRGVERFGVGQWVTIRINSDGILMSRTGTQIKDCYRTMLKRGEI